MIRTIAFASIALLTAFAVAAPKDDVAAAAKKLADSSYSWKTTSESAGGQGRAFSIEGKTEKAGFTLVTYVRGDTTTEIFIKGAKAAIKTPDGWKSGEEVAQDENSPVRFAPRMVQNFKAPAAQAEELAEKTKDLKEADGAIAGELTEDAAKSLLAFGGRGGGTAPEVANPKGTIKFWVKDGVLIKLQYNVQGKVTFNNNERDVNRTTTVEIKDIGSTKLDVPDDAKKKIG